MAFNENCQWWKGFLFCAQVCTYARTYKIANAWGHCCESGQSCRNWSNTKALSTRKLEANRTHETVCISIAGVLHWIYKNCALYSSSPLLDSVRDQFEGNKRHLDELSSFLWIFYFISFSQITINWQKILHVCFWISNHRAYRMLICLMLCFWWDNRSRRHALLALERFWVYDQGFSR